MLDYEFTVLVDEEIKYRLYVVDKISKGREAVKQGEVISVVDLKKEMKEW